MPTQDRRREERSLRALEFTCTIDGKLFDALSLDLSPGGAFMAAAVLAPTGAVAHITPRLGARSDRRPPILLYGLVVRQQRSPRTGVALQWLKCESCGGVTPLKGMLENVLGFPQEDLPHPPPHIQSLQDLEYDFILREIGPGRSTRSGWDGEKTGDGLDAGWRVGTPPDGTGAQAPLSPPTAPTEVDSDFADEGTEPAGRMLVYRPTTVEIRVGVERIRGVVHSLGSEELLLAVAGNRTLPLGDVTVVYPVPVRGNHLPLELECTVRAAETMEGIDAIAHDLEIRRILGHRGPELWGRWIGYLFERKKAHEPPLRRPTGRTPERG